MFTFGRTLAAQKLEELVSQSPSARRKISSLLSDYTNQLLQITMAKEPRTVRLCMEMLRDYTLRRLDVKTKLTDDIRSYAKNVVIYRHRVFRKEFDAITRIIQRRQQKPI